MLKPQHYKHSATGSHFTLGETELSISICYIVLPSGRCLGPVDRKKAYIQGFYTILHQQDF